MGSSLARILGIEDFGYIAQVVKEQRARVQLAARLLFYHLGHAQGQQRISAQLEEIVGGANPLDPEDALPDVRKDALHGRLRQLSNYLLFRLSRKRVGQRCAIYLA